MDVLLYKSHYPPQEDYGSWSSDDKEQFRIYRRGQKHRKKNHGWSETLKLLCALRFRVDISDTLMYVYEMLGAEVLTNLYDRLGRQLMDPQLSAGWQVMSLSYPRIDNAVTTRSSWSHSRTSRSPPISRTRKRCYLAFSP